MKRPTWRPEDGFLLDKPRERIAPKSQWLLDLEEKQRAQAVAAELAKRARAAQLPEAELQLLEQPESVGKRVRALGNK